MGPTEVVIPAGLLPSDGRFGAGPSKVRPEAIEALAGVQSDYLGTSHRQSAVRSMVGRLRSGLADMYSLPDGYEVVLGNGGATSFWDAMAFGLIESRSQHLVFGEFSSKCSAAARAPHLAEPDVIESEPGTHPSPSPRDDIDLYALTHNETSTGVVMPVRRVDGGVVAVDGTSAAGGLRVDPAEFDVYYFSLQKGFASDGGLWVALCSPPAIERIETIAASSRYLPASLNLKIALDNARKDQTYNTPALATLLLAVHQIEWIQESGGLEWSASRCEASAGHLYAWAEGRAWAQPFVGEADKRSPVVGTIDLDATIDATAVTSALRANGILDTEPYRKLGRNQLRVGMYPAVEPDDVAALTKCVDHVVDALG